MMIEKIVFTVKECLLLYVAAKFGGVGWITMENDAGVYTWGRTFLPRDAVLARY